MSPALRLSQRVVGLHLPRPKRRFKTRQLTLKSPKNLSLLPKSVGQHLSLKLSSTLTLVEHPPPKSPTEVVQLVVNLGVTSKLEQQLSSPGNSTGVRLEKLSLL